MKSRARITGRRTFQWLWRCVSLGFFWFLLFLTILAVAAQEPRTGSMGVRFETWNFQQGTPEYIQALAQTKDGFLWIGSPAGLYRFDGVRFESFHAVSGDPLLSTNVYSLFAPSSGGLWVGYTFGGFSFVSNGRVTNYGGEIAEGTGTIFEFAEGPDGSLWATTGNGLWRFERSMWGRQDTVGHGAGGIRSSIGFDRSGILWLIDMRALYYLLPGATQFRRAAGDIDLSAGFARDSDRKVLTRPDIPHDGLNAYPIFRNGTFLQVVDRNNGIWDVRFSGGVIRRRATMPLEDAVSNHDRGNSEVYSLHVQNFNAALVDREGNVWFADEDRLYRFYYSSLIKQELPNDMGPFAISVDGDANVWIACWARPDLYRVANRKTDVLHTPIPERGWSLAYAAPDRTVWFGGKRFLWHLVNGKLVRVQVPAEVVDQVGFLQAITPDRNGGLWFSFGRHGLYRFADGTWTPFGGRKDLPRTGVVSEFTDRLGRVWFGYTKNQLGVLDGDRVRIYGLNDGIRVGNITAIYSRGPSIWIGGEFGLQQFDNGRLHDITAVDGDRLRGISGIIETANGNLWLNGISGIFHITRDEVSKALQDPRYRVKGEHLGSRNGLPGVPMQIRPLPSAVESGNGRLWFALTGGVVWIDPNRQLQKAPLPSLAIQSVSADDKSYAPIFPLNLPAHTSSLSINYSAVSLSDPQAVRFRYRLQEVDSGWHETNSANSAVYRNLAPGNYHFMVAASDTDGAWSDNVASAVFTILPAWYQTNWFLVLCVVTGVLAVWALYQLRMRQVAQSLSARFDERLAERTRVAREIHDTLLQTVQGSKMVADDALDRPDDAVGMQHAMEQLSIWLGQAAQQGRETVNALRASTTQQNDLAQALRRATEDCERRSSMQASFSVSGDVKEMHPVVRDEVYRIGYEAIRNACVHSRGSRLEVRVSYSQDLIVRVADNGVGIDPGIVDEGKEGHFGLQGLRERAARIEAKLTVVSSANAGTEITVVVPGSIVFRKPSKTPSERIMSILRAVGRTSNRDRSGPA